jgi:hypothetical protein
VRRGLLCICILVAFALSGCIKASIGGGGGGSVTQTGEAKRVVDAAVAYTVSIGERDAAAACALMTPAAQAKAARAMGAPTCQEAHVEAFTVVKADNHSDPADMIRRARKKVSIHGDEAALFFTGVKNQAPLVFRREGDQWKLAQSLLHLKKTQ